MIRDTTVTDVDGGTVEWLDAASVCLFRDDNGMIRATVGDEVSVVRPCLLRAFPITDPDEFIELREDGGASIGVMKTLDGMPEDVRAIADELIRERYMVPHILEIREIRSEFGTWVWDVRTDRGDRSFTIRNLRDDIRPLPGRHGDRNVNRVRISDIDGNVYEIRDLDELPASSRAAFDRIG